MWKGFEFMRFPKVFREKRWAQNALTGCIIAAFTLALAHLDVFLDGLADLWKFFAPVFWGWVFTYILDPFVKVFEKRVFYRIQREAVRRRLSVVVTLIVLAVFLSILAVTLIPQLFSSLAYLVSHFDSYAQSFDKMVNSFNDALKSLPFQVNVNAPTLLSSADRWIKEIASYLSENAGQILNTSYRFGATLINILIAFILAIYFLVDKKRLMDAIRRFMKVLLKERRFLAVSKYMRHCHEILIRYIAFDLLEGLIVGIVNWIFMVIMRMPYAVLISVVIGLTNLAPTFGPIAGAAIGSFILVLVNPWQALYFLIFTLILQTVDGYILKPRLFGDKLGVSSVLILICITVGSKMFGVTGILLAIPFAAIFDFTYRTFIFPWLEKRDGPEKADG